MKTNTITTENYNGFAITVRNQDTYIDGTALCRANGKKIAHYQENKQTKEFLEELSSNVGIPILNLVVSEVGGNHAGTFVHPRVAIHLAQWASPKCAVWVTDLVYRYMSGETLNVKQSALSPDQWTDLRNLVSLGSDPLSVYSAMTKPTGGKSLPSAINPHAILRLFDSSISRGQLQQLIQSKFHVGEHKAAALIKSAITLKLIKPSHRAFKAPLVKIAM